MATIDDKTEIVQEQESELNIKELFYVCLSRWYWILLSVIIFMGFGMYYILKSTPIYTRNAQIVIKEDSKRNRAISQFDEFASMGLFQNNTVLLNEIATLQSPDMMQDVVNTLNLQMNYAEPGRFHNKVLYGSNLPINVKLYSVGENDYAALTVNITPDGAVTLSDFANRDTEFEDQEVKGKVGQMLKTPLGDVTVFTNENCKIAENMEIKVVHSTLNKTIDKYCKEISIAQDDEKSGVVDISINDASIQRGDDVITTLIDTYNKKWIADRNEIALSTRDFIEDRLNVIMNELEGVDSNISSYKKSHLVPDVAAVSQMYMQNANIAGNKLLELNNQLGMAQYVKGYLNVSDGSAPKLIPANSGFETPTLASEIGNYNSMVLNRNNLVANSNESNPLVIDMDKSLGDLRVSISSSIDNVIESLKRQIRSVERQENDAISKISSNPEQAKYLLSVERQQKVKESLYLYLLQKREENEISQTFTPYNTKVIMTPRGADHPSSPRKVRILALCFVLGLALPIGLITLNFSLYNKVRGRKDLDNLDIPYIGEIPLVKGVKGRFGKKDKKATIVAVEHGKRDIINEAFRVVRANLEFMMGQKKIIALTSANPDSGKTFIDYNLALCFALKGKKVLTIDCDFRKKSLSNYVGDPHKGLTDYIVGKVDDVNSVIVKTQASENLFVLPCGTTPPNPTELLYDEKFKSMLQELRDEYNLIFIDCPPVEVVADAAIVNKNTDMTIFVVRAGLFDRDMLPEIEKMYKNNKLNDMVVVLNGTSASRSYGTRYTYNYGYYGTNKYEGYQN